MKILFLTLSRLDDIDARGIYSDLMRTFIRQGHEVYIASPTERRYGKATYLIESPRCQILKIRTLNIQKTNVIEKGIGTLLLEGQFNRAIRKYWGEIRFDLLLYSTPPITFNQVIECVKNRCACRTYLLLKDIFPQNAVDLGMFSRWSPLYWMFRYKERRLYRLSDHIGCMSPANVAYILEHNPKVDSAKVHVNPNSIEVKDLEQIDKMAVRQKYGLPVDRPVFIYGGNLGKPQGVDFLLQVLEYYQNDARMYFVVAGSGTEYGKVSAWFEAHHPANARLQSHLPKPEYDQLVAACDVGMIFLDQRFTIPNYPSRLLSYLEVQMPVIIASDTHTDIGPIAEQNGFGLWSESGDIERFDENLCVLLSRDEIKKKGEAAYRFMLDNYTVDKTYSMIIKSIS